MVKNNKLIVKSNYIIEASYKLTLGEQRVIYILTSMINMNDEEFKPYRLTVKEFGEILGTKNKDLYSRVAQYVESLRERDLTIVKEKSILKTKWLSSAEYFINDGYVELCFDPKLKPYLLMLKERFTKLSLEQMVSFNSQYSGRIYELLKQYEKIGERTFALNELRTLLGIGFDEYTQYGLLKQRILNKAKKEINSKSDLIINFEEIKEARKVISIKFIIKHTERLLDKDFDASKDITPNKEKKYPKSLINQIKCIFKENISELEIKSLLDVAKGDVNIIKEKYSMTDTVPKIDNLVGWIVEAIKKDYQPPKMKVKPSTFNNFEQREFDESLEWDLLGWNKDQ